MNKKIVLGVALMVSIGLAASSTLSEDGLITDSIVPDSGDEVQMEGDLVLPAEQSDGNVAVSLAFAEQQFLNRDGSESIEGDLDVAGNELMNVNNISSDGTGIDIEDQLVLNAQIDMNQQSITNLPQSGGSDEPATFGYVDDEIADEKQDITVTESGQEVTIDIEGGNEQTFTDDFEENTDRQLDDVGADSDVDLGSNEIVNLADPTGSDSAINEGWANAEFLNRDGSDSMGGNLDMTGNRIENLPSPSSDEEAARRGYVDDEIENVENEIEDVEEPVDREGARENIDMQGNDITTSEGEICIGDHC